MCAAQNQYFFFSFDVLIIETLNVSVLIFLTLFKVTLTCCSISISCVRDINTSLRITSIPPKNIIHKRIYLARTEIWI